MDYIEAFNTRPAALSLNDTIPEVPNLQTESIIDFGGNGFEEGLVSHTTNLNFDPFWFLLVSLALLAIISNLFYKQYRAYLLDFFSQRLGLTNYDRDERLGIVTRLLNLFFILNVSLFTYKAAEILEWELPYNTPFQRFLFLFVILFIAWIAKTMVTLLTHALFSGWKIGRSLLSISQQAEFIMTLVLIPVNFIIFYANDSITFISITTAILSIILVLGIIKLFLELRQNSSYFNYQIIIYLCTLELLPIMVLIKYYAF